MYTSGHRGYLSGFAALNVSTSITMGAGAKIILDASTSQTDCPLQFAGDPNTGLCRPAADQVGVISAGGLWATFKAGQTEANGNFLTGGLIYLARIADPGAIFDNYGALFAKDAGADKSRVVARVAATDGNLVTEP